LLLLGLGGFGGKADNLTIHLRASIEPVNAPHFVDWAVDHFLNLGILEM